MIPLSEVEKLGGYSADLQVGKAAEHLVVADLLLHGYAAFLTDAGTPYDLVVEANGLKRVQVKATQRTTNIPHQGPVYRFGTRRGKGGVSRARIVDCDFYALVALDIRKIAYFTVTEMIARTGSIKQTVDLKSRLVSYKGRIYSNGTQRTPEWGRYLQDFSRFDRCL